MEFLTTAPKRDNQVRPNKEAKMFSNGLPGHIEMSTKVAQGLTILLIELVEQQPPAFVRQGFKDQFHQHQLCNQKVAYQAKSRFPNSPLSPATARLTLAPQIQSPRPEIDDTVVAPQNLRTQKAGNRPITPQEIAVNQAFQIDYADIFTNNIHRSN
jgi:hypothetical protein